jgi:aminoglycoside/choline kinase family phosphotransferase
MDRDWAALLTAAFDGLAGAPRDGVRVAPMTGDASARSYARIEVDGAAPVVLMLLADDPLKSDEVVDGERPKQMPFLEVGEYLARGGMPVPVVLHVDLPRHAILLEDLGDVTVERALAAGEDKAALYHAAIELLADLQAWGARSPEPDCVAFRRRFGEGLLRWELEHFDEWLLRAWTGRTPTVAEKAVLDAFYDEVVRRLVALPSGLVHRDYQSRNLMVQDGRLRLIDFQDALVGPYLYDLVALLRDSYVAFQPAEAAGIRRHFRDARVARGLWVPEPADLDDHFFLAAMQRKMKDAGRFVYIDRVKKNPKFLPNIPRSLAYAREALERFPEFAAAREVLAGYLPEHFG